MTFKESFISARNWAKELTENATIDDILIAVVGNKSDLIGEAEVHLSDAVDFAKEIGAEVCKETSAKDNLGIDELFQEIGVKLYRKNKAKVI